MAATSEPTLPSFCVCGVNKNTIDTIGGHYYYTNKDNCKGLPFSIHIKGDLSKDVEWPGDLRENAAFFNHTIGSLDPNMIFHVERSEDKKLMNVYTYACLGKL